MNATTLSEIYQQTVQHGGWWDASSRSAFDIAGDDRAQLLQGFCTADIEQLATGAGTEAFILNPKGKILGYVRVFALPEVLAIDTAPDFGPALIQHLDKYVIREKVTFADRTDQRRLLTVVGPRAAEPLALAIDAPLPETPLQTLCWPHSSGEVRITRSNEFSLPAFRVDAGEEFCELLREQFAAGSLVEVPPELAEVLRIEQGTPAFGKDVTEDNLPQEVARDDATISLTKGCYLGQETVARIDALGHVNRLLVGFRLQSDEAVKPGTELLADEKVVGRVTSCVASPGSEQPLGLGYVRRGKHLPGTQLVCGQTTVEIKPFPLVQHG